MYDDPAAIAAVVLFDLRAREYANIRHDVEVVRREDGVLGQNRRKCGEIKSLAGQFTYP